MESYFVDVANANALGSLGSDFFASSIHISNSLLDHLDLKNSY